MATSKCSVFFLVSAVLLLNAHLGLCGCYKRIFSFGDSIIDTGNFVHRTGSDPSAYKELPFGMTFFKHPSGRICDGRVLVDFYAEAFGLPLLPPSMPEESTAAFDTGSNFAVLASIALDPDYFKKKYDFQMDVPSCLGVQLASFNKVLARIAPGDDATRRLLNESLVVMGEIGGNDYNFWFLRGGARDTPEKYMPDVVARIGAAVQEVIGLGARTVLVPGNFPIGCVPAYLSRFHSDDRNDYDEFGCLKFFNDFSQKHNGALQQEVGRLRSQNPGVKIIYADYYGAAMQFVQKPQTYGVSDPLVACCGGDGKYHTDRPCDKNATVWGDPQNFASWDGMHMTEKAYSVIADGVLDGPFADTPLRNSC